MILQVLSAGHLRSAAQQVAHGPYVAGARISKPWWKLLALLASVAAFGFLLLPVLDPLMTHLQQRFADPDSAGQAWRPSREWSFLAVSAAAGLAQFIVVMVPACLVYRTRPRTFLWPQQVKGWQLFVVAFVAMFAITAAISPLTASSVGAAGVPLFAPTSPVSERLLYVLVAFFALAFPVIAEEALFRGVLLRVLGGLTQRVWLIVLINALLFSAFHTDPDPVAFVMRMMTGAFWTWAALRLGGIAFSVGSHLASNLSFALLVQPGSIWAPGSGMPASILLWQVIILLPMLVLVELIARRRPHPAAA